MSRWDSGKSKFGCVGKVDRDSGPSKAIRRPLVDKLSIDKRTQIVFKAVLLMWS